VLKKRDEKTNKKDETNSQESVMNALKKEKLKKNI